MIDLAADFSAGVVDGRGQLREAGQEGVVVGGELYMLYYALVGSRFKEQQA